jgi:hypothetical protein
LSVQSTRHEDLAGVVPGLPGAADLADVWLGHALACLLDGCEVPEDDRAALVEFGRDELESDDTAPDEARQLRRLDACRSALALSALAVEARLNRVLRRCHAAEWSALLRLSPAERFRLAPRLLDELEWAARDAELSDLVEQVFAAHDELVDAAGSVGAAFPPTRSRFGPDRARDTVEASAELCCFLADLTGEDEGAAPAVREAARALRSRAWRLSGAAPRRTEQELGLNGFGDFPPDVIGS